MPLPTEFVARKVSFLINPSGVELFNAIEFEVVFPNLGAPENEDYNDAANAAALAAYQSLDAAYPTETFTLLRRYEGIEESHTDITPGP